MSKEERQVAIESDQDSIDEAKKVPENAFDYLDLILEKNTKLSGIIDCIGGFSSEVGSENLGNLGWAMHDFTDAIDELVNDLWDHLRDIGALTEKEAVKPRQD